MEALLIVQSIALLVLMVSNLLTVLTLKKVREDVAGYVTPQRYILNAPVDKIPTTEEIVEKIKQYEESQKPVYDATANHATSDDMVQRIKALNDPSRPNYGDKLTDMFVRELTPNEIAKRAERRKPVSENAKKFLAENIVIDEHAQKLAEADAVIKEHADKQKIELAQKLKAKSRKAQMEAKEAKKAQDHTDLRDN